MIHKSVIRLTKQFTFESAHALWNYDGPCRNIHGHSYILFVTVKGVAANEADNPKQGMLLDFSDLKRIVNTQVVDIFDHALIVNANTPHRKLSGHADLGARVMAVNYQPTCENMVVDIAARISQALPEHVQLHSLKLHETATSFVEWFADDNPPLAH